jgi:hypothetical protein
VGSHVCCTWHQLQGVRRAPFDVLKNTPTCVGVLHRKPVPVLNVASLMYRMPRCVLISWTVMVNTVMVSTELTK